MVTDEQALADLGEVPTGEADIEIPAELLCFLENPMTDGPQYVAARDNTAKEAR